MSGNPPALPCSPLGGCGQPCAGCPPDGPDPWLVDDGEPDDPDCPDESPDGWPEPLVEGPPLAPGCPCDGLLEPGAPPPGVCCDGKGDSLPPWLGLWPGLPPEGEEGDEDGDDEPGGCGIEGDDVELDVMQPASARAQAAGHARRRLNAYVIARTSGRQRRAPRPGTYPDQKL